MAGERCPGCGATVPVSSAPAHRYLEAAPGCWERYGALLAWAAELPGAGRAGLVQDLVDCFALQHPTHTGRENRQSVAVHLVSLCLRVEHGAPPALRRAAMARSTHRGYPLLAPLPERYERAVADLAAIPEPGRAAALGEVVETTWDAWAAHQGSARAWLAASG